MQFKLHSLGLLLYSNHLFINFFALLVTGLFVYWFIPEITSIFSHPTISLFACSAYSLVQATEHACDHIEEIGPGKGCIYRIMEFQEKA